MRKCKKKKNMKYEVCSGEVMKWESIHATTSTRYKLLSTQVEVGRAVPGKLPSLSSELSVCLPRYTSTASTASTVLRYLLFGV